jgi:hypothetical protein
VESKHIDDVRINSSIGIVSLNVCRNFLVFSIKSGRFVKLKNPSLSITKEPILGKAIRLILRIIRERL